MMVDELHTRLRWPEAVAESLLAAALVLQAGELARGVQQIAIADGIAPANEIAEVVQVADMRTRPSETDEVEIVGADARKIEASLDRQLGEAGVVLHAAQ